MLDPSIFTAGETVSWGISDSDYSSADYSLAINFASGSGAFCGAGVADGSGWLVTLGAAVTAACTPGRYAYQVMATAGTGASLERYILDCGTVRLLGLLDGTSETDFRSPDEKILDAIIATMEGRATTDQQSVTIGDTSIGRMTWDDLINARNVFQARVNTLHRRSRITRTRL